MAEIITIPGTKIWFHEAEYEKFKDMCKSLQEEHDRVVKVALGMGTKEDEEWSAQRCEEGRKLEAERYRFSMMLDGENQKMVVLRDGKVHNILSPDEADGAWYKPNPEPFADEKDVVIIRGCTGFDF